MSNITAEVILGTKSAYSEFPPIWTFKITFPRYVAEQLLKHRVFEICANSSRAMTVPKMNKTIEDNPANPTFWGSRKKGMQPGEALDYQVTKTDGPYGHICRGTEPDTVEEVWEQTKDFCMQQADALFDAGCHQQIPNRLTHAFQMTTYILTGTDFSNFFKLRLADDAQDEIQILARCMKDAMDAYDIQRLRNGWHLPYVSQYEYDVYGLEKALKLSAARCCVVSYNNQDGTPMEIEKAEKIYSMLVDNGGAPHYTPVGMAARVPTKDEYMDITRMQETIIMFHKGQESFVKSKVKQLQYYANYNGWCSNRFVLENNLD